MIDPNFTARELEARDGELARLRRENAGLKAFAKFALAWCDRGPPHGGPGKEADALNFISNHPILRTMRRASS
jgi:hypothetical protein